jgi:hypothetical protein
MSEKTSGSSGIGEVDRSGLDSVARGVTREKNWARFRFARCDLFVNFSSTTAHSLVRQAGRFPRDA